MSSAFRTWEEVSDYITSTKGYDYLTNPTSWMNAFKEKVKNSKWVDMVDDAGVPTGTSGFYNTEWITEGDWVAPTIDSGVKSVPTIETVVTDLTTGTAVAGADALATEAVGTTITLTTAGYIASTLVALGLGVGAYETAPEFFTDLSNAMFGTNLTYDETEPFLHKKIKALLSTNESNELVTYADTELLNRAYNFLKTHITGETYAFLDGVIYTDAQLSQYAPFKVQTQYHEPTVYTTVKVDKSMLTPEYIQLCEHQVWLQQQKKGVQGAEVDVSGVISNLRNLYPNIGNADVYNIFCSNWWTPNVGITSHKVAITGYRITEPSQKENLRVSLGTNRFENYMYAEPLSDDEYAYSIGSNYVEFNSPVFSYQYDVEDDYGVVVDNGGDYIGAPFFFLGVGGGMIYSLESLPYFNAMVSTVNANEDVTLDAYLNRNGVKQTGKTPVSNKTAERRYADWWLKNKKPTWQPDANGNAQKRDNTPLSMDISDDAPNKVIQHGVNNPTDPSSYKGQQNKAQDGTETQYRNPIDDYNKRIQDDIDDYNKSKITPKYAPDPNPEVDPEPRYPDTPPVDPKGDSGDTPNPPSIGGVTVSGMVSVYNPTKQQLKDFSAWLWSPSFLDNFLKIFANPMDAIIGLHIMYATPTSGGSEHIIAGYLDSGVSSKVVTQQYTKLNCGTVTVPEYFGNATDYEPYTTVHIYLPFIGIMPLRADDVIGKQVKLEYGIDALTGTCLASITTYKDGSEITCYTFAGNCSVQIPVSGGNYAEMIKAIAGFVVAGAGSIATGNPIMALGAGASIMSGNTSVQHSGAIGSNAGACGIRIPYLIVTRKKPFDAQNYQHYYGFPANKHVTLSSCKGYTQVRSCHVESIYRATDNEKAEIESLLKQGVIII